jgi:hypothetical protein
MNDMASRKLVDPMHFFLGGLRWDAIAAGSRRAETQGGSVRSKPERREAHRPEQPTTQKGSDNA